MTKERSMRAMVETMLLAGSLLVVGTAVAGCGDDDAGDVTPMADAGCPAVDSGCPAADAGCPAGCPAADAGCPAGCPAADAGCPAGCPAPDAGCA